MKGIIIPVRGLDWMTINLLESIKANSKISDYRIVVVDNGSTAQEFINVNNWLSNNAPYFYHPISKKPLGFVKAVNQGIRILKQLGTEYYFILNNDILVSPEWDTRLLYSLAKDDRVGLVGGMTTPPDWRELNQAKEFIKNKSKYSELQGYVNKYALLLQTHLKDVEVEQDFLAFYCIGIKGEVIDKVGVLDEVFNMGLFDDDDYCYRVKKAGYKIILRQDVYIHHYHRSSFTKYYGDKKYMEMLENNRKIFKKKHGFDAWDRLKKADNTAENDG